MTAHADDRGLELPYGDITGPEQFWDCIPGEEYSVCDPGPRLGFGDVLQSLLPASLFGDDATVSVSSEERHDPLHVLPYDILLGIFEYLETSSMLALMSASTYVCDATRAAAFWKHMLRLRILPWFWESRTLLEDTILPETFDHKGLFLWINHITYPSYGLEGPFMGIANRRRIWDACQPLLPMYRHRVAPILHAEPKDEEAIALLNRAKSYHMPIVRYPLTKGETTASVQFIRTWHEIGHRACDFDTYWNDDGALVGIATTFGTIQRVLGSTEGMRGVTLHIDAHDWIKEIIVSLKDCDMFQENIDRSHYRTALDNRASEAGQSYIEGMEVSMLIVLDLLAGANTASLS